MTLVYPCAICGQMGLGEAPHGSEPCPQKVMIDEAYVQMLDAQASAYRRLPGLLGDLVEGFRGEGS